MGNATRRFRESTPAASLFGAVFIGIALASAFVTVRTSVENIRSHERAYLGSSAEARQHTVSAALGFPSADWDFVAKHVGRGDRFLLVVPTSLRGTPTAHDMATYAGYRLLPAIAVTEAARASVVVYLGGSAKSTASCFDRRRTACVLRRHA